MHPDSDTEYSTEYDWSRLVWNFHLLEHLPISIPNKKIITIDSGEFEFLLTVTDTDDETDYDWSRVVPTCTYTWTDSDTDTD